MKTALRFVGLLMLLVAIGSVAPAQEVRGTGTNGLIPLWLGDHRIGDSVISQSDGTVNIAGIASISLYGATSNASDGATGLFGTATSTTGVTFGVQGFSASPSGVGVQGTNNTSEAGNGGAGIAGFFNATSGSGNGVFGQTSSPSGAGVVGSANSTSGVNDGVIGTTSSNTNGANGVFGEANASTGYVYGVQGYSNSANGSGVAGWSPNIGVQGSSGQCGNGGCTLTTGIAGVFNTASGGTILEGTVGFTPVFRVDSTGKGFFDNGTQTGGADFAESVAVAKGSHRYEPGDLLVLDATADRQLKLSAEPYSTLVAGIYSTKPGVLGTTHKPDDASSSKGEVPVAIVGIVPCKVSAENGPIERGNLLVTSSTPGYAMKGTDRSRMLGAVVGKAMEPLASGTGTIQVLVTLQ